MLSRRTLVAGVLVVLAVAVAVTEPASPPATATAGHSELDFALAGSSPCKQSPACERRSRRKKHRGASLFVDNAGKATPMAAWGTTDCANASRHQQINSGGDWHSTANGHRQGNDSYRRLTVIDGDDLYGERCELGQEGGPTVLYHKGQRRVTQISLRLPANFPLGSDTWQVVMQMKQSAPATNSGGTPVLELDAYGGRWRLRHSSSSGPSHDSDQLWSAPARTGVWTRFSFDVRYSSDPLKGVIRVSVDLNGDGDFNDRGERSDPIRTYTLKVETPGGSADDGIAPGQSIPSHLRAGIYHDPAYPCPAPFGCSVDLDNVQVVAVRP